MPDEGLKPMERQVSRHVDQQVTLMAAQALRHRVVDVLGLPEVFRKLPPWIAAGVVACSAARRARDLGPVVGFYQPKQTRWQVSAASRFAVPVPVLSGEISDENADVPDEYIDRVVFGQVVRWADDALLLPWPTGPRWWTTRASSLRERPPAIW
jgi:hypothetical protein